ncbi:multidrug effflux MFS transporter [Hydrogenophaga sp.]|uniref:multidrug effflux MFS transporter n=1 Tax=Hydrogenophaga sp. TaxID=1904254 RepID=UPI0025BAC89E|nr:multidrug effflux MFS transporter [Hydrogenophaga sp.]MBT9463652.1 multidrug effflux MFS transporter [Hydrogenophaga sp.]
MSASSSATPSHGPLIANLIAQLAFGLLAMTICLPSMQEWGAMFGSDQASVQLTFSGYVVAYGGLQLLYGPWSDRLGRKKVLMFGLTLAGLGSVLAALSPSLAWLTAARVLQGAGCAAGMVVGRAMVQDLFTGPERTRVMAYVGMAMGLIPPTATILGGQIHVRLGWQANFVLIAVLAVVLFVAAWKGLPDHTPATTEQPHWLGAMLSSYARLAREPSFLLFVFILAMTTANFYAFLAGAPIVLGSYGVGPAGIGYYIMVVPLSYILGNYLTTHLVHRTGDRAMMMLGQVCTVGGVALMLGLALANVDTPLAFALPLMLMGLGNGFLVPPALTGTVGLVPALAGSAAAVAGLAQQLMGAVGGYTVGLVPHHGAVNLGWLMLGLGSMALVGQVVLNRRRVTKAAPVRCAPDDA